MRKVLTMSCETTKNTLSIGALIKRQLLVPPPSSNTRQILILVWHHHLSTFLLTGDYHQFVLNYMWGKSYLLSSYTLACSLVLYSIDIANNVSIISLLWSIFENKKVGLMKSIFVSFKGVIFFVVFSSNILSFYHCIILKPSFFCDNLTWRNLTVIYYRNLTVIYYRI